MCKRGCVQEKTMYCRFEVELYLLILFSVGMKGRLRPFASACL